MDEYVVAYLESIMEALVMIRQNYWYYFYQPKCSTRLREWIDKTSSAEIQSGYLDFLGTVAIQNLYKRKFILDKEDTPGN